MAENITIILAIIFQFAFNAAFIGFIDAAYNHPSWGRWGWAKDLSMIFLLVPLAWLEDYGGYVVADTLAITGSWAPLGLTVFLAFILCGIGYIIWWVKQAPAPIKDKINLSKMETCELEHVHNKLDEFLNSLKYVRGSHDLFWELFQLQQQLVDEEMKRVS